MSQKNGTIQIDDETVHFSFNSFFTGQGERFFVMITRGRKFYVFDMSPEAEAWKIVDKRQPIPEWLLINEAELSEQIKKTPEE